MPRFMTVSHASISNVGVMPFRNPYAADGGPVLTSSEFQSLRHFRSGKIADRFDLEAAYPARLDGEWNYVGLVHDHFGHVMSEMIHRIVSSRSIFGNDRWIAVAARNSPSLLFDDVNPAAKSAFEFLGLNCNNLLLINQNTIIEQLNICQQGAHLAGEPDPDYLMELGSYSNAKLESMFGAIPRPKKLYVSRTGIPHGGGNILGERYIAELLAQDGFTVFHPERYNLSQQMDFYRKAEVIVFSEGSACHGTELLGPAALKNVYLIQRRPRTGYRFDCVLRPRSLVYERFRFPIFLGTAAMHPFEARRLIEWGVSILDIEPFLSFMKDFGVSKLIGFDRAAYGKATMEDLEAYIEFHQNRRSILVPTDELERMREIVQARRHS